MLAMVEMGGGNVDDVDLVVLDQLLQGVMQRARRRIGPRIRGPDRVGVS